MAHHKGLVLLLFTVAVCQMLVSVKAQGNVDATYKLPAGASLIDDNHNYVLVMQWDCNLVLYEPRRNGAALWSSGSSGRGSSCYATMQVDGVFAIYDGNNKFVWGTDSKQSDTEGCMYEAILQNDGNFVLYCDAGQYSDKTTHPIWASNTSNR